jgi:uncharacterized membrane protein
MPTGSSTWSVWAERARIGFRILLAVFMTMAGVSHFTRMADFVAIVPPQLPDPVLLVQISGVAEIAGGVGLLVPVLRRAAGIGLVLLYVAVFPANIYMALHEIPLGATPMPTWAYWVRLPLQVVLIAWALWVSRGPKGSASSRVS